MTAAIWESLFWDMSVLLGWSRREVVLGKPKIIGGHSIISYHKVMLHDMLVTDLSGMQFTSIYLATMGWACTLRYSA